MKINPSELFALQAREHLEEARKMKARNDALTRWTVQAERRKVESIPAVVGAARLCNHLSIQWRRKERKDGIS